MIEVITVNKNKFTEFFKGKGYYALLFVGVMAIAAVAVIGSQLASEEKKLEEQEYVNLNDTGELEADDGQDTELAENNPIADGIVNHANDSTDLANAKDDGQVQADVQDAPELEGYEDDSGADDVAAEEAEQTAAALAEEQAAEAAAAEETASAEEEAAVETTGSTVQNDAAALESLSFQEDDELLWPVSGDVIMNYSMDHTIYFATLMQYKVNPAIILKAEVGTEVKAATDGVITAIEENDAETGYTITMAIGNDYNLVYGQLSKDSVSFQVGDAVSQGAVIGSVSEPTKYYSVEGSNLYFQMVKNDESVNPLLYLH